jgi:dTDP-4-dehydrorhamnose reductase
MIKENDRFAKVVILGDGQIGKALAAELPKAIVINRNQLDFTSTSDLLIKLHMLLDSVDADVVINTIGLSNIDFAESNAEIAEAVQVKSVEILGKYLASVGIPLIHFSSDMVFGQNASEAYVESDTPVPTCVFGKTKLLGEQALMAAHNKSLIFRLPWVYSIFSSNNFVVKLIEAMLTNPQIAIVDDQFGNVVNTFDLSRVITKIVQILKNGQAKYKKEGSYGVYHLAPMDFSSRFDIANEIMNTCNKHFIGLLKTQQITASKTADFKTPAVRPLNSCLDSSKFNQVFGFGLPNWHFSLYNATQKIVKRLVPTATNIQDEFNAVRFE